MTGDKAHLTATLLAALNTAAEQYGEFAKQARQIPTGERVAQQFDKQRQEALDLAFLIENDELTFYKKGY